MKLELQSQRNKLEEGGSENQYVVFSGITPGIFATVENTRGNLSKVRFTYFADIATLIVKIPRPVHEVAHVTFGPIPWFFNR
jgi:hypothetical protein